MPRLPLRSRSPEDTRAIGAAIGAALRPGDVVALAGDLGAGKTCFVQGAARGLEVLEPVTSPSFVLVREYRGRAPVLHVDVYRLDRLQELLDLGYDELVDGDRVVFVEWGDAVAGVLPDERLDVEIRSGEDDERSIVLSAASGVWSERLARLRERLSAWEA